jgi:hypothetical protein
MADRLRWCEVEIDRDVDDCWRLLCEIDRIPDWVPGVTDVRVTERDDHGRASVAHFIGGRGSGAFAYVLRYSHDDATHTQRWRIEDSTLRDLDGEARVIRTGYDRCRLYYGIHASTAIIAAGAILLRDEAPDPVAESFRTWAESRLQRS